MVHEYKTTRRIEFADTDMAGIVHFANFFRFMEASEHEFFRTLGIRLHDDDGERVSGWVRVHASCDYRKPARYPDLLQIHLVVRKKSERSIRYECTFRVVDDAGAAGEPIATGEMVVVHVAKQSGEPELRSAPMPPEVARTIEVAPA